MDRPRKRRDGAVRPVPQLDRSACKARLPIHLMEDHSACTTRLPTHLMEDHSLEDDSACTARLPIQLLEEIFVRLPLNDVGKFRAVSQEWKELLGSQEFLKLREVAHRDQDRSDGLRILVSPDLFVTDEVYDTAREGWHSIKLRGMDEFHRRNANKCATIRGNRGLVSDGGLLFYDDFVVNVLTGSQRHLQCAFYGGRLELSAVKVETSVNTYQAFFHAKEVVEDGSTCSSLLIYNSKEHFWSKTQRSPFSLEMMDSATVCKDCVYFALDAQIDAVPTPRALDILCYDLTKEMWTTNVITPARDDLLMRRILHEYKSKVFVVSLGRSTYHAQERMVQNVLIDEVDFQNSERRILQAMSEDDFMILLKGKCRHLHCTTGIYVDGLTACGHFIGVSIICRMKRGQHVHLAVYDLRTQKWSATSGKRFPRSKQLIHMVAFDPTLSIIA